MRDLARPRACCHPGLAPGRAVPGQEQLENVVACPQQTSRDVPEVLFPSSPVVSGSSSCLLIWAPFPAYFCCLCSVALTGMCG